jgi:hypothetical protein
MNATSVAASHDIKTQSTVYISSATVTRINFILFVVWILVSTPFLFHPSRMYHRHILHNHHRLQRGIGGELHRLTGVITTASTLFQGVAVFSFQFCPTRLVSCQQTTPSTTTSISRLFSSPPKASTFAVPTMGTDDDNPDCQSSICSNAKNHYSGYEKWVRRLYATNMFHPVKLGLDNMRRLHQLLGNPMDDVSCVWTLACVWFTQNSHAMCRFLFSTH